MRVKIIGENDCAKAARGLLRQAGFAVTEVLPGEAVLQGPLAGYVITIEEIMGTDRIHIDSVDCPFEAALLKHITQLSKLPVVVDRPGGVVHGDREIVLLVPASAEQQQAVEFGVLRGLLELNGQQKAAEKALPQRAPWYKRLFA